METLCYPVGGGVIDIENVTQTTRQNYIDKGYYYCGDGNSKDVGYCISQPDGTSCTPAPIQEVKPSIQPKTLPATGTDWGLTIAIIGAIIVGLICWWQRKRIVNGQHPI